MPVMWVTEPSLTRGLLVAGTQPRCGKTVACAGITGVLRELDFHVEAIKPLSFLPQVSLRQGLEQGFFDKINPPVKSMETVTATSPHAIRQADWRRVVESCRRRDFPYLLETPGSIASPLFYPDRAEAVGGPGFDSRPWLDAVDLAVMLQIPLLLVMPHGLDPIGALSPLIAWLQERKAPIIGWVSVETQASGVLNADATTWEQDILALTHQTQVPYLGKIAYSPSISVELSQQGNLLRQTETGIDLLPIQQALELSVFR